MSISHLGSPDGNVIWPERKNAGTDLFDPNDLPRFVVRPGSRIGETDQPGECCYLIERGLVASYVDVDGIRPTCVGLAGAGDIIELSTLLGKATDSAARAQAIVPVQLLRLPVSRLREILDHSPALLDTCLQQLQANMTELQHVAACNARHLLPSRCAHWLLRLQSRLGDALPVTHEFLASVLGVRRAGITVTLQTLQRSGAIRQQRGSILIVDAAQLRATACGCPISVARPPWVMPAGEAAVPQPASPQSREGPRIWVDTAIRKSGPDWRSQNLVLARIEAALQVCHQVMDQTHEILAG